MAVSEALFAVSEVLFAVSEALAWLGVVCMAMWIVRAETRLQRLESKREDIDDEN